MKRILGEVSVRELDGCLKKVMELLKNRQFGHYYLYELGQFLHEVPVSVLAQKWLEDLSYDLCWERAEKHFKKTKQLWYNELEWPFQICVLEIGGIDNKMLRKKWLSKLSHSYPENKLTKHIDELDLSSSTEKRKIKLIRLRPGNLGFQEATFEMLNCAHPKFNLSPCPPETAFFLRPLVKEYFDSRKTIFSIDSKPSTTGGETKKRVFYFDMSRGGHGNYFYMRDWDITPEDAHGSDFYWIFEYIPSNK